MNTEAHARAVEGGLQGWSVGSPYPFLVVAIDNPTGYPAGLYWYVVDTRNGSTDFKDRIGLTMKGRLASTWATCHAEAFYRHRILGEDLAAADRSYDAYFDAIRNDGGPAPCAEAYN